MYGNYDEENEDKTLYLTIYLNGNPLQKPVVQKIIQNLKFKDIHKWVQEPFQIKDGNSMRVFNNEGIEMNEQDIQYFYDDTIIYVSKGEPFDAASTFSEYNIEKVLGEGGFGKVLLGVHKKTGEKVAIKILKTNQIGNAMEIDSVFKEAEILKNLCHPGIVQVKNCITLADFQVVFIMEFLEGGELLERLEQKGTFSEEESKDYFKQIVNAMNYCHKNKLIHRDLKLENLLCLNNESNIIRVCDFGIAGGSTFSTDSLDAGSLMYMPPEVLEGKIKKLEPSIDVWGMGIILYTMLCGKLPFTGETIDDIIERIVSGKYTIPSSIKNNLSADCLSVLYGCLNLDPSRRVNCNELLSHPWLIDKEYEEMKKKMEEDLEEVKEDYDKKDIKQVSQYKKFNFIKIQNQEQKRNSIINNPKKGRRGSMDQNEVRKFKEMKDKLQIQSQLYLGNKMPPTHKKNNSTNIHSISSKISSTTNLKSNQILLSPNGNKGTALQQKYGPNNKKLQQYGISKK